MDARTSTIRQMLNQLRQMLWSHSQPKRERRSILDSLIRVPLATWTVSCSHSTWHLNSDSLSTPGSIIKNFTVTRTIASRISCKNYLLIFSYRGKTMWTPRDSLRVSVGKEPWVLSNTTFKSCAGSYLMLLSKALPLLVNSQTLLMICILERWPAMSGVRFAGTSHWIPKISWIYHFP